MFKKILLLKVPGFFYFVFQRIKHILQTQKSIS